MWHPWKGWGDILYWWSWKAAIVFMGETSLPCRLWIHQSTETSGTSHWRKGTLLDQADFMACRGDFCLLGKPPVPCVQVALRSFHPCGLLQKINTRFAQVLSSPWAGFRPRQDSKISWYKINSAATWGEKGYFYKNCVKLRGQELGPMGQIGSDTSQKKIDTRCLWDFFFFKSSK